MTGYKKYVCDNCDAIIYIKEKALEKGVDIAKKSGCLETGGILVGMYSSSLREVYINDMTSPPQDSQSSFSSFFRGVKGLKQYLQKKWDKNDEYYLGEWHFHPANVPEPSSVDMNQLMKISTDKRYNCKEPLLIIISKNKENYNINIKLLIAANIYSYFSA